MARRFQFSLRTLLAATLAVACFAGGMVTQRELSGIEATQRDAKLEKENRRLKELVATFSNDAAISQQRYEEEYARNNPHLPQSQRYLPQPHPKQ